MRALILILALTGCALFSPTGTIPVSQTLSAPAQQAQSSINEANVLLAAAANVIAQNVVDGITPKDDARAQLAKVKSLAADVDRAKRLLEAGDIATAGQQAELARKLIVALHREVAQRRTQ